MGRENLSLDHIFQLVIDTTNTAGNLFANKQIATHMLQFCGLARDIHIMGDGVDSIDRRVFRPYRALNRQGENTQFRIGDQFNLSIAQFEAVDTCVV